MATTTSPARTRGARTPNERATDAAQRTATLFEKLPSGGYNAAGVLTSLAVLLRWGYSPRQPSMEDAARALHKVVDHWGYLTRYAITSNSATDQLHGINEKLREVVERLGARHLPPERPTLTLVQGGAGDGVA